jgi:RNA polymerase sigma-70 factor (ECF subfamily)
MLYEHHHGSVLRYAWRRVGANEAQDIVHETFTVAWRRLDEVPVSAELPWLYKIAYNVIRNSMRKARNDSVAFARLAPSAEPDHAEAVHDRQAAIAAVRSLSASERELLQLVAWEGLDAQEAGAVLGCGRAAVYLRLHRLRKRLVTLLDEPEREKDPS